MSNKSIALGVGAGLWVVVLTIATLFIITLKNPMWLGLLIAAWGVSLVSMLAYSFSWTAQAIKRMLAVTRSVERSSADLNTHWKKAEPRLAAVKYKVDDIAGSVGRTSQLLRELESKLNHKNGDLSLVSPSGNEFSLATAASSKEITSREASTEGAGPEGVLKRRFLKETTKHRLIPSDVQKVSEIPDEGFTFLLDLQPGEAIALELVSASVSVSPEALKSSLICAKAFDINGTPLDHKVLTTAHEEHGSYTYVHSLNQEPQVFSLSLPSTATTVAISVLPWKIQQAIFNEIQIIRSFPNPEWVDARTARDIKVAVILDEFSHNSFSPEFNALSINPTEWRSQFEAEKPDIFFCESAWSGKDPKERPWKGKIYASENFPRENRTVLIEILEYCNLNGIPTVFWNKEDPTHFADRKHDFVKTALLFDHIFTTDSNCISQYQDEWGHRSVHSLPFAVQPKLFNPIPMASRSSDVVFAGSWYENHEDRSRSMEKMFDAVLNAELNLKIYDRYFDDEDPLHKFPEKYQSFIVPPVSHEEVSRVYKESAVGMTINTVTNSPTMFARRVFELMACNTLVVSNYSQGIDAIFGKDVVFLDRTPEILQQLDEVQIREMRKRNVRKVLTNHTYKHRFEDILSVTGVKYGQESEKTALLIRITDLAEAQDAWHKLRTAELSVERRILLVASEVEPTDTSIILQEWNTNGVQVVDEALLLEGKVSLQTVFGNDTHVYISSNSENLLSQSQLAELGAHTSYVNSPIKFSEGDSLYEFERVEELPAALYPRSEVVEILDNFVTTGKTLVYSI